MYIVGALEREIPPIDWGYFACSSLVLYGLRIIGFHARKGPVKYRRHYAIKNQRSASNNDPFGNFCILKPLVGALIAELVLYGIRLLWTARPQV